MDINEIRKLIENETDPSMKKYYQNLLGDTKEIYSPKDDPRIVVVTELRITHELKPGNDDVFQLSTEADQKKMKDKPFTLVEGENYKLTVSFRVQHNIVAGLKIENKVTRMSIKVDEDTLVLGSYRPQKEPHTVTFPKIGWNEAPHGTASHGSYTAKMSFIDDDSKCHLKFEYNFKIVKKEKN